MAITHFVTILIRRAEREKEIHAILGMNEQSWILLKIDKDWEIRHQFRTTEWISLYHSADTFQSFPNQPMQYSGSIDCDGTEISA